MAYKYNTTQRELMIKLLKDHASKDSVTIVDFIKILRDLDVKISEATIYRKFKTLEEEGVLRVYMGKDGVKTYEYIENEDCKAHIHMVCNKCKKVMHLDCVEDRKFIKHIEDAHNFTVNKQLTVIYGTCDDCK